MEGYGVLFSSRTGNTRALAEAIRAALPQEACVYFGESGAAVPDKRTNLIEMRAEGDIDKVMSKDEYRISPATQDRKICTPLTAPPTMPFGIISQGRAGRSSSAAAQRGNVLRQGS